jgi:hypothetical protein
MMRSRNNKAHRGTPQACLRPEARLLLACARTRVEPEQERRIKDLLREEMDWDYVLATASRHGTLPLVYSHLSEIGPEGIPESFLQELRRYSQSYMGYNLFLTGELLRILELFASQGVRAVPFKGPVLASTIYGNLCLRRFGDLDLLVHRRDVLRARELLISHGYQGLGEQTPTREAAHLRYERNYKFIGHDGKALVELHWEITPAYWQLPSRHGYVLLDPEHLLQRLLPVPVGEGTTLSFTTENLLLVLCVHGAKHWWDRLIWICDIAELARVHPEIDWEQVLVQACNTDSERILFLGLLLAHELLEAPLPEEVLQKAKADETARSLAALVAEWLFQEEEEGPFRRFQKGVFHIRLRDSIRDRMQYSYLFLRKMMVPSQADRPVGKRGTRAGKFLSGRSR